MRKALMAAATLTMLAGCGAPSPTEQIGTDRFVGLQARMYGTPQAPQQEIYCYRTRGNAECVNRPLAGHEYRIINYYDAGTQQPAPRGVLQRVDVDAYPQNPTIAPPVPAGAPTVVPTTAGPPLWVAPPPPAPAAPATPPPGAPPPPAAGPTPLR